MTISSTAGLRGIRCAWTPGRRSSSCLAIAALILSGVPLSAQSYRVRIQLAGFDRPVVLDTLTINSDLDAPLGAVFRAVQQVFFELKIPVTIADSSRGLVLNGSITAMRKYAGRPMSSLLNCGSGITGPNADIYRLSMAIGAFLTPLSATRTRLGVALLASGVDVAGDSKAPVNCGSQGIFEAEMSKRVAAKIRTS